MCIQGLDFLQISYFRVSELIDYTLKATFAAWKFKIEVFTYFRKKN